MGVFPLLLVSLLVIHIKCQANITSHLEHSDWSLIGPAYKRGYLSGLLHFEGCVLIPERIPHDDSRSCIFPYAQR